MIRAGMGPGLPRMREVANGVDLPPDAMWIDLLDPAEGEKKAIEGTLGIDVPTPEEMQEIEISSRLRQEPEGLYMTATLIVQADTANPLTTAVTFILAGSRLITLRYLDSQPFRAFAVHAERHPGLYTSGFAVLGGLVEAVIDRAADILERTGSEVDGLSRQIFNRPTGGAPGGTSFREVLDRIGHNGNITSKTRESLVSLGRMLTFLGQNGDLKGSKDLRQRMKTITRDILALSDHATFLSNKVNFLLDATLGMINIEQNNIIKIFSVAAVVFLPPTLIASIYGMNFRAMPELDWHLGYPLAVIGMIVSAVLPYLFFKRRGWL
jgi:magnesium transporter